MIGLRTGRVLASVLSVGLFVGALVVLHRILGRFHADEVLAAVHAYPMARLAEVLGLTVASYGTLSCFDWLALRHLGRRLPVATSTLVSFVSHAISHNAGFAILTGGSVRLRMYSAFGLSPGEVGGVIAFAGLTFALGVAALGGTAFLVEAPTVATLLHVPSLAVRAVGAGIIVGLAAYLAWSTALKRPLRIGRWSFVLPQAGTGLAQMAIAALDLALVGGALYVLLPLGGGVSYPAFVGIYVVATVIGIISHVPGGLGVFEGALVILLPAMKPGDLLGALLVFRLFYNLLPLLLAAAVLVLFEVVQRSRHMRVPLWLESMVPLVAMALVIAAGAAAMVVAIIRMRDSVGGE
jgi:uncharacterized membrane protein YbhN (UPF0104 family)